ncbi:hypothetical protein BC829DRAFT_388630 [Chytridium lagenaria]|nr:hypothetical protein BC829DRAFT_388630 [Chytridium lagenaria]
MASTASSSATAFTAPPRQQSSEPIPPANLYGDEKASGLFNPSVMGGSSSSSGYAPDTMFGDEKKKMAEAMLRVDAGASPSGLVLPFKTTMASSEDVARWSTLQVVVWLYSLGLREDIVLRLQERNIDGAQLITLNDARLQDLGVGPAPVRQSILSNLQTLRGHSGEVTADAGTGELAPPPYIPH